jgi:hypothetical protein
MIKWYFYVPPVESILRKLPVFPLGDTGTIQYSMLQHVGDFVGAAFDTREEARPMMGAGYGISTLGP